MKFQVYYIDAHERASTEKREKSSSPAQQNESQLFITLHSAGDDDLSPFSCHFLCHFSWHFVPLGGSSTGSSQRIITLRHRSDDPNEEVHEHRQLPQADAATVLMP
ncbi:Nodulin MtN3 family protein [Prunus dulcis]|uniref:Nodulin MtN3 family protein n=1 Tax=Prunus dulcis TaxID=3755 RepID=A0A4Y1R1Q9_PRUDU|nr:hypothetical protein Prudu_007328 [Prunus dulcis]BBG98032.1 Nodulin MtN3 family protein [Prunus dulcis]